MGQDELIEARLKEIFPTGPPNEYGLLPNVRYYIVAPTFAWYGSWVSAYLRRTVRVTFVNGPDLLRGIGQDDRVMVLTKFRDLWPGMEDELRYLDARGVAIQTWDKERERVLSVRFVEPIK
jgi:hypothetical protein